MVRPADLGRIPSWFVVLPDCDSARPVAAELRTRSAQMIPHPSGRPWLAGRWPTGAVTVGSARDTTVALVGQHTTTAGSLTTLAAGVQTPADLDRFSTSLVGSAHLLATVSGQVRVEGTVTGLRPVFRARIGRVDVVADRADVLARLLDAPLDERRLAVYLLNGDVLYPVAGQPAWRGVTAVPGDHYLLLDGAGRHRAVRRWTPPEPVLPLAEGAVAFREALSAAVAARTAHRDLVTCDLGGLDSTSICSLAARGDADLVAYTAASQDTAGDDVHWASRTVQGLGNVEHHVIPADQMPLVYQGLFDLNEVFDQPCSGAVDHERWRVIPRRAAARGSGLHLTGLGGDEVLYGSLAHLHSLLLTRPATAVRHLRGFAVKYRWPLGETLRQLADRRPYRSWLTRVSTRLTEPLVEPRHPLLDWGYEPRLAPWATPAAVDAVRELILAEAPAVEPLSRRRGQHRELESMRFVCRLTRQLGQISAGMGLELAAPYYDDRVIEAGLAIRPEDRITPWRYKPLILEAMHGIVPDDSLSRQTKANGTCDEATGMRQNRADLLALWEESRLAELGLVDAAALREVCTRPLPPQLPVGALYSLVACEVWLRSLEDSRAELRSGHGSQTAP